MNDALPPIHPGEVLLEEFLKPLGLSPHRLSLELGVPSPRIHALVHKKRRITADTALRLGLRFGTTPQFWLNLQNLHDLELVRLELGDRLSREVHPQVQAG